MAVLLWQFPHGEYIVLWDGENTYWVDEMIPSSGYTHIEMELACDITFAVPSFIGML